MICYFWESLKPSIKVEMEQQNQESINFEEMVQRAVNMESKVGLRSSTMIRDSDTHFYRSYRLSYNTFLKVQTQGSNNSSRYAEPKLKDPNLALSYNNVAEPTKKEDRKEKKKRFWN